MIAFFLNFLTKIMIRQFFAQIRAENVGDGVFETQCKLYFSYYLWFSFVWAVSCI